MRPVRVMLSGYPRQCYASTQFPVPDPPDAPDRGRWGGSGLDVAAVYRDRARPLALVVMERGDAHALVWLSLPEQGTPVPVEVTLKGGAAPSERRCKEMLRDYRPPRSGSVTTALLRSLSLSGALNALATRDRPDQSRVARLAEMRKESSGNLPESFRNRRDHGAALERVLVAALYVDEIQADNSKPVQAVANRMGKSSTWVNKRLAAARSAGYLTSYGHGRRGGDLTEKAWELIEQSSDEEAEEGWDEYEDDEEDLTEEELAALGEEDWTEDATPLAEEDEELDTYGGWVLCHACLTPYEYLDEQSVCANCADME